MATATSWEDVSAIFKAYPNVKRINQDEGCFDKDDNKIDVDQDNIDAPRVELDKKKYQVQKNEICFLSSNLRDSKVLLIIKLRLSSKFAI